MYPDFCFYKLANFNEFFSLIINRPAFKLRILQFDDNLFATYLHDFVLKKRISQYIFNWLWVQVFFLYWVGHMHLRYFFQWWCYFSWNLWHITIIYPFRCFMFHTHQRFCLCLTCNTGLRKYRIESHRQYISLLIGLMMFHVDRYIKIGQHNKDCRNTSMNSKINS